MIMNQRIYLLLLACLLLPSLVGTREPCSVSALPSTIVVGDTAIWDADASGTLYNDPLYTGSRRLIVLSVGSGMVELRLFSWGVSGWGPPGETDVPDDASTIYWLEQNAAIGDTVVDLVLGASYPIIDMTEGVDEDTGQAVIRVATRHPITDNGWNVSYDTSARLALRMRAIGLVSTVTNYGFHLYNTSVELGSGANAPPPIPGFPFEAVVLGLATAVGMGVLLRRRRGGVALRG